MTHAMFTSCHTHQTGKNHSDLIPSASNGLFMGTIGLESVNNYLCDWDVNTDYFHAIGCEHGTQISATALLDGFFYFI